MKTKSKILLIIVLVIIALTILRETGIFNLNLHTSASSSKHSASMSRKGDTNSPYDVIINWKKKQSKPGTEHKNTIVANLSRFSVTGNTWLPLYKNAAATYKFKYSTPDKNTSGDLDGMVKITVKGLCSHNNCIETIKKNIEAQISKYFRNQLKTR